MHNESSYFLTVNGGSSSIKFSVFAQESLSKILVGKIDRIGMEGTTLFLSNTITNEKSETSVTDADAVSVLMTTIQEQLTSTAIVAIGHRVVHGGNTYYAPTYITDTVLKELESFSPFAPLHLPNQIALIRACMTHFPDAQQIALFDTGFHHHLPQVAQTLPLPRKYSSEGIRRYGYHGLSYEYLMHTLTESLGVDVKNKKIILAHLGNGSSLTAVRDGKSVETTMGFTPNSGIPMSTRSGDLDPGIFEYLHTTHGMSEGEFQHMINFESGVLGVSNTTADMEVLIEKATHDPLAEEALAFYAYHVKKAIGALSAVLGGVDVLVFTGGIGERGAEVRARVCTDLGYLGIALDTTLNETNNLLISSAESRVILYVIPTDEELIMAKHVQDF